MAIDNDRLNTFLGRAVGDLGAAISATLMLVGDRLGLYRALAASPATPADLAQRTHTHERYIREWLANQAAGGYVTYDADSGRYSLDAAQALDVVLCWGWIRSRLHHGKNFWPGLAWAVWRSALV